MTRVGERFELVGSEIVELAKFSQCGELYLVTHDFSFASDAVARVGSSVGGAVGPLAVRLQAHLGDVAGAGAVGLGNLIEFAVSASLVDGVGDDAQLPSGVTYLG